MTNPLIPPGMAAAIYPEFLELVSSPSAFTGILVDVRGRVTITIDGEGVRATFGDPDGLRALAHVLGAVADHREALGLAAADDAAADLARVTTAFAGNA